MKFYYYEAVAGLVAIMTNEKKFSFSYGQVMPEISRDLYSRTLIKIDVVYEDCVNRLDLKDESIGKFHYFLGIPEEKVIEYRRNWMFGSELALRIENATGNHVRIFANRHYRRFVKHRFMNLHSVGYIATDLINLLLLKNGYCPLHCSAIAKNGEAYVIFAPPNTGKTLTSMQLCMKDEGFDFAAEDLGVTDGTHLYAVPWTSTFRYYSDIDQSLGSRILNWLTERISVLELLGAGKIEPITKYIAQDRIAEVSKIKGIFILERGHSGVEDISIEEGVWRIHTLDRYEFNYMRAPSIVAYEYFNYSRNIENALEAEANKLSEMVQAAEFVKIIRNTNALEYAAQIRSIIS